MVVGERTESVEEKWKRHIEESKNTINGWEGELQYAVDHQDLKYEKYCNFMISVWKNTLERLEKFEII